MKLMVEMLELEEGKDKSLGLIGWDGKAMFTDPPQDPFLVGVVSTPIMALGAGELLKSKMDPFLWLSSLQYHYRSPYLRATAPIDMDSPPKNKPVDSHEMKPNIREAHSKGLLEYNSKAGFTGR